MGKIQIQKTGNNWYNLHGLSLDALIDIKSALTILIDCRDPGTWGPANVWLDLLHAFIETERHS